VIFLAFLCLILPGLAWWAWLGQRQEDPIVAFAQIVGVSLAIIPLLALAGFVVGFRFTPALVIIILIACALLTVGGLVKQGFQLPQRYRLHLIIGLVVFGLAVSLRLYQSQDLLLPNWVDSQHHFLIIKTILENSAVPQDLMPYLQVPFYYHFGYHAIAALFTAISNLPIGQAMLILGQVLNAAVGLSVYALSKNLWRNWRPALAAALLVSFATRMPAYYLSWGRYTLLTGLVLLPVAMGQSLDILRGKNIWRSALALTLLTAGILLSHYFAAMLLAIFLGFLIIVHLAKGWQHLPQALMELSWILNSAICGLLLVSPWLGRIALFSASNPGVDASFPESFETILSGSRVNYIWQLLGPTSNHWLLLPAGLGLLFALRKRGTLGFGLWSLVLIVMAMPWGVTLRPFRPDHFAIVLFLPLTLLAASFFWQITGWLGKLLKQRSAGIFLLMLILFGWIGWGYPKNRESINPVTVLVNEADLMALDWIVEKTPPEAHFYINTTYWMGNSFRGADGGGWILPYTGRWALVPTIFYGFSPDGDWSGQLRDWGEAASQITSCSDMFWNLVEEAELGWVYLREGVGSLQPEGLSNCAGIREVYAQQGAVIYKIER